MRKILIAAAGGLAFLVVVLSMPADGGSTAQFLNECEGRIGKQVEVVAGGAQSATDTEHPPTSEEIAKTIVEAGQSLSITQNGIMAALAASEARTNMQIEANSAVPESLTLTHSTLAQDSTSLGIFAMQYPTDGTAGSLMDPTQASVKFYNSLTAIDKWRDLEPSEAAARVLRTGTAATYKLYLQHAQLLYNRYAKPTTSSANVTSTTVPDDVTPTTIPIADSSTLMTTTPSEANPFASLTAPSDAPDLVNDCVTALREGPIAPIGNLIHKISGPGASAAVAAYSQVGDTATDTPSGSLNGPAAAAETTTTSTNVTSTTSARAKYTFDELTLVRYAIYQGSGRRVVLPTSVADINIHGARVDPDAIVPGDLVFTDFTQDGPQRIRIAIDSQRVVEADDGQVVAAPMPTGNVVIKRFI